MIPLKPVSDEMYARIGKAYTICAEYPEVFGDVTYKRFVSLFVDVIDEEDAREERLKSAAPAMYELLRKVTDWVNPTSRLGKELCEEIEKLLRRVDEGE